MLTSAVVYSGALLTFAAVSQAQIIGGPGIPSGNCLPFGCGQDYQQVYAASDFSHAFTITDLTFYNKNYSQATISNATYTITLSTTSAAVNGLSTTFTNNLGADNTLFFSGVLSGPVNTTTKSFTIAGAGFNYDPSQGNLLVTVHKNQGANDYSGYFDYTYASNGLFSRLYSFPASPTGNTDSSGLVTGFNMASTPEPSTDAALGVGALGLGVLVLKARRRKNQA